MYQKYLGAMMKNFLEKLANSGAAPVSSDHLGLIGKRAAGSYIRKEAESLNAAVHGAIEGENLNSDQVRRVVEMANQATWNETFHGGSGDSVFEPADYDQVMGSMDESPAPERGVHIDYLNDVPNQTKEVDWDEVFRADNADDYAVMNPAAGESAEVEKVAGDLDIARYGTDIILSELTDVGEQMYNLIKQAHVMEEHGILQIAQAVGLAVEDPKFGIDIMKKASARLEAEGVKFDEKKELMKVAHPLVVNTDHALVQTAAILEKLAYSYYSSSHKLEGLREQHLKAARRLKDKLRSM